jgi:hypothetical protein
VITNDRQNAFDLAFGLDAGMVHLNTPVSAMAEATR